MDPADDLERELNKLGAQNPKTPKPQNPKVYKVGQQYIAYSHYN